MRPRYLAYIILVLMAIIALSSCKAYKERICRECTAVNKDEVTKKDTTIYLHDTVSIPFPVQGPIQYLENPCKALCDSLGRLKPFEVKKKTNGITGTIKSVGNSIAFDCKSDSLTKIIDKQIRTITELENKQSTKTIQEDCKKKHLTEWDAFWIRTGQICLSIIALFLILKAIKVYFKLQIPFI